ncbi:MAG: AMP-binding protein [Sneathiella sp.]
MPKATEDERWNVVRKAVSGRRSVRGYLKKPIPREMIEDILELAGRAPSGGNFQPWQVHVVTGEKKENLEQALRTAFFDKSAKAEEQYPYYPAKISKEFSARKHKAGEQLYSALGIGKRDIRAMREQKADNYRFFGAPVGLLFTIPSDLQQGSWLDMGTFLASVMIAARGKGLDTCPQASFISYHSIVRKHLGFSEKEELVCGMALGYADPDHPANSFVSDRQELLDFVTFHDQDLSEDPIFQRIKKHSAQQPAKVAFSLDGNAMPWAEFDRKIEAFSSFMNARSPSGQSVALSLPNSADFLALFMAGLKAGKTVQVLDPDWPDALRKKAEEIAKPDFFVDQQMLADMPAQDNKSIPVAIADIDAPFYAGFTSGSTGVPKGFIRSQRSWIKSFTCDTEEFGLSDKDIIAALGNFTHSLPLYAVIRALYEGATALFYSAFRPTRVLRDLHRQQASVIYAVPTQLQALVDSLGSEKPVPSVRLVLSSGAKCAPELQQAVKQVFPNASFAEFYGSSELSYVTVAKEEENPPPASVGRAFGDVEIRILDEKGKRLPAGQIGRLFVKSPYRFIGYAGSLVSDLEEDGLFVGDTGYVDDAGFLYLTGRADRMITVSARNVFPEEIEACLIAHPYIRNIAAFGLEEQKRGNRIVAVLQGENRQISRRELRTFCAERLASYAVPHQFFLTEKWPLTRSGKTDFAALKQQAQDGELEMLS